MKKLLFLLLVPSLLCTGAGNYYLQVGHSSPAAAFDTHSIDIAATSGQVAVAGSSVNFDGSAVPMSVSILVKVTSGDAGIVSNVGSVVVGGYRLARFSGTVYWQWFDAFFDNWACSVSLSSGAWHYIVGTNDGTQSGTALKLYLDGSLVDTQSGPIHATTSATPLTFGADRGGTTLNGKLDQAAIYTTVLSLSDVRDLCGWNGSSCTQPPDARTLGSYTHAQNYWPMGELTDSTSSLVDLKSGNNLTPASTSFVLSTDKP